MKKQMITVLVLTANIVFCQQNKSKGIVAEKITAFSNVEKKYDKDVKLKLIVEKDASCTIKSNHTIVLEEGFEVSDASFYIGPDDGTIAKQAEQNSLFSVYPNPSSSIISITSAKDQILKITVTSLEGKQILKIEPEPTPLYTLDVSAFSKGIYIISVETANHKNEVQKFIKE